MPYRQASFPTAAQPKSLAVAGDSTLFVAEIDLVEAVRSNQKVYELKPSFSPTAVAATGTTVAIGGEVRECGHSEDKGIKSAPGSESTLVWLGREIPQRDCHSRG